MKFLRAFVASAIAVAGMATPAHAFNINYPQACQPTMSHILYYDDDFNTGNGVTGAEVTWCDSEVTYLGRPDVYSWTEGCNPCA